MSKKKKPFWKKEIFADIMMVILVVAAAMLIEKVIIMPTRVIGTSMYPTLNDNDFLVINRLSYTVENPERFDIIVFEEESQEEDEYLIKRVIGLPGETVFISENKIYINGSVLEEYYWYEDNFDAKDARSPVTLGEDEFFVMGDNRNVSVDSRSNRIGVVKKEQIVGNAVFRIFPFNDIGSLKHQ